jgi:hypothetical protein
MNAAGLEKPENLARLDWLVRVEVSSKSVGKAFM